MRQEEEKMRSFLIMHNLDKMPIKGAGLWVLKDNLDHITDVRIVPNTITVYGDYLAANGMSDQDETFLTHMGVGETSGGKTTASNALEAQVAPRVALDSTTQSAYGDAEDNNVVYVCTFGAAVCTGALVEAGLFNSLAGVDAGSGEFMFAYQEFSVVNKGAADSLVGTWTVTFGAS